jgi:hypothetical protein
LAEIKGAEQLGQAYDLRPLFCSLTDTFQRTMQVFLAGSGAAHLDQADGGAGVHSVWHVNSLSREAQLLVY